MREQQLQTGPPSSRTKAVTGRSQQRRFVAKRRHPSFSQVARYRNASYSAKAGLEAVNCTAAAKPVVWEAHLCAIHISRGGMLSCPNQNRQAGPAPVPSTPGTDAQCPSAPQVGPHVRPEQTPRHSIAIARSRHPAGGTHRARAACASGPRYRRLSLEDGATAPGRARLLASREHDGTVCGAAGLGDC